MDTPAIDAPLRFGSFELQRRERRLLVDGHVATLGARAFDVLVVLVERPGRLVDKATLMELVWPGLVVQENNLAAQVSALRKLLGDGVIATIPGRGYRFVARLVAQTPADGALRGRCRPSRQPRRRCAPICRSSCRPCSAARASSPRSARWWTATGSSAWWAPAASASRC